jgi:hypothetical protein
MDLPACGRRAAHPVPREPRRERSGQVHGELRLMARRLIEEEEVNVIVLSDRGVNKDIRADPGLAGGAGLHHYLIREGLRTRVEPRDRDRRGARGASLRAADRLRRERGQPVPRVRDDRRMIRSGMLPNVDHKHACKNFVKAATKGVIKVASKMGISACRATTARRCSRPWACARTSSTSTSPGRPRASAASAST